MRGARLIAALSAVLVLSPLIGLTDALLHPPPDPFGMPQPDLATLLSRSGAATLLANSVALSVAVSLGAMLCGGWLAWAEQRMTYPGRRLLGVLSLLPLATPSYLIASTVSSAVGPGGLIGGPLSLPRVSGLGIAAVVLSVACAPYVQLLVGAALARSSASEEEAARSLGAGPWRVFTAVIFPRLRPALALSALISLLYAISDFGAVAVLDCPVLTWRLYGAVKGQQLVEATLLGGAVLAVTIPLFIAGRILHGTAQPRAVANPRPPARRRPGAGLLAVTYSLHSLIIGLGVALPVLTMGDWIRGGLARGDTLSIPWIPIRDTVGVSLVAALIVGLLALAPAWIAARDRRSIALPVEQATLLTSALPGVLLALGLVMTALLLSRSISEGRALYAALTGSGLLLFVGYTVRFLAEGFAALKTAILRLDPRQEESARALGASRLRWLTQIALPDLAPGIAATALLLFLAVLKELPVTLLLGGAVGLNTLAFRVWDRYSEALWLDAGVAGLVLLSVSLSVVLMTLRWRRHV